MNMTTHTSASDRSAVNVNESTDHTTMSDEIQSALYAIDAEKIYNLKYIHENNSTQS